MWNFTRIKATGAESLSFGGLPTSFDYIMTSKEEDVVDAAFLHPRCVSMWATICLNQGLNPAHTSQTRVAAQGGSSVHLPLGYQLLHKKAEGWVAYCVGEGQAGAEQSATLATKCCEAKAEQRASCGAMSTSPTSPNLTHLTSLHLLLFALTDMVEMLR